MEKSNDAQPFEIKHAFLVFLKNNAFFLWMMGALFFFVALISILRPVIVGYMIHNGYGLKNIGFLSHSVVMLLIISIFIVILSVIRTVIYTHLEVNILHSLQAIVMKRILAIPVHFFDRYPVGDLVHRILWIASLGPLFSSNQMGLFLSFISLLMSFNIMLYFNWQLTVLVFMLVGVLTGLSVWASCRLFPHLEDHMKGMGQAYGFMFQVLQGMSRIKLFAREQAVEAVWMEMYGGTRNKMQRTYYKGILGYAFFYSVPSLFLLIIFNAALPQLDSLLSQHFVIFFCSLCLLIGSIVSFYINSSGFIDALIAYRRLLPILQAPLENTHALIMQTNDFPIVGFIRLNNIHFCYPDSQMQVLHGVDCLISPGQHVAFVGLSGSGKSTILKLLLGFYFPQQGHVEIDGRRLCEMDLSKFRSNIGVVLQDSQLMYGTIFENIMGHMQTIEEAVAWQVLATLGLDEFVAALPMGIHTMVSSSFLSGGQKQLLLIARALVGNPKLLLLDEATSSLDNRTQTMVISRINQLKITRVTIAHRISTIKNADKIFVLHQGKIVQTGTYQQLMKQKSLFYQLANTQE
ncbi:ATP-binding cassette domain-containing protein [Legionella oakridgensis]|uniref:ABC-type bacteriocin/lantibiotic exporters, containing an N-terminal double-glycine peptidase domain n=2 Tax=Legionella oakridgensis TaxID=29423 RepID=W0BCH5_9GAMM|nr:ATP-binding cassette domain-containing protein [Legionella oakridgensis]AHE67565.1 ABC-type bacteriocin/lantibiotic exporters, containing an N-terminal double-glycine peptidase domain [Legionella oakridgensis ATCC 33761 = DSM 21215]ETO92810.1 ABC-type bacteriocin/lantibiotic exporter [Legionella oakridgensis RV-2-2007]KTD37084.1 ABC transporter [Legionella oakridgensis]STY20607.1 ABC transporter [Legionella longbeachae]